MSTSTQRARGPVHLEGHLDEGQSRWLWLVKWLLVIPHYIVLFFLWIAFAVTTVVAFFAILFTGRYPRSIFEYNVGVLRWSWRVAFYAYSALGTDRYPPFTLQDVPEYPARLRVDPPGELSRGLVLVKWWLLAIPHYLVVAFFLGGGWYAANSVDEWGYGGPGLIGLLVFFAAVALLFTGRYPKPIFDLVLGLNRWVLRVAAYVSLMTDEYPPFRLDMGGDDPEPPLVPGEPDSAPGATAGGGTAVATAPAPPGSPQERPAWGAGRVVAVVLGSVLLLTGAGLGVAGLGLGFAQVGLRDSGGYLASGDEYLSTQSYALASDSMEMTYDGPDALLENILGDVRITAEADGTEPLFLGIGPTDEVDAYLAGVAHDTLTDFTGTDRDPVYRHSDGSAPAAAPGTLDIWAASTSGTGEQELTWAPESGDWTIVLMQADGQQGVAADVSVGAELPVLGWVAGGMLVTALLVLGAGIVVVVLAIAVRPRSPAAPAPPTTV
ncbi:DUF4389 domain-containing protein [Nocardioides sp. GY 10113]|uniref:DUF4389 domain-containing protein n=1 Tax=Nocardioides sp. GY 10113 TaxID=2569761 RepID=UPI0010A8F9A3|nr:DUF4389 domain-containing protein [Nocardioides sp. GY 10113]TIC88311.1 DUF4389 domain-containing protein [Nocardioides sp. GY 10113]